MYARIVLIISVKGNHLDFQDPVAARELSRVLLLQDFDLDVDLSLERLIPPVPNRLNYVLWIEDLIGESDIGTRDVVGIDIGTGASAIFPLLCCRRNPSWQMYALEVDTRSIELAVENIQRNGLQDRITLLKSDHSNSDLITQHEDLHRTTIHFTMCNPPFYSSQDEIVDNMNSRDEAPSGHCTGATIEMITEGGEVSFTEKLLQQSLNIGTRILWYSTMLGKLSSLYSIVLKLRKLKISNYAVCEFVQGNTRRWGIAWSFGSAHPLETTSRCCQSLSTRNLLPTSTVCTIHTNEQSEADLIHRIEDFASQAHLDCSGMAQSHSFVITASHNTWSRTARRGRSNWAENRTGAVALRVQISIQTAARQVEILWRYGSDKVLWESLCCKIRELLR